MMKWIIKLLLINGLLLVLSFSLSFPVVAIEYDCANGQHKYVLLEEKVATVSEDGYIIYECELCGDTYTRFTYKIEHQWSEWVIEKEPSCTAPGIRKRACTAGIMHSEAQEIPAAAHKYAETRTKPNCTEPGYSTYTCSVCGHSYIETFGEPGEHNYVGDITKEADCEHEGVETFTCLVCGHSYTETFGEPGGHNYVGDITKEADCEHEGVETFTCDRCGGSYTEALPAIDHNYGEWITDKPAEEDIEGLRYRECEHCGYRITETFAVLPVPPEEHDEPFFGLVEIAVTVGNVAVWIFLFLLLASEIRLMIWIRQQKKRVLAEKEEKEDYEYESL